MSIDYFAVSEEKKRQYWDYFCQQQWFWPAGFTVRRLERIQPIMFNDRDFWADIIHRHNGDKWTPEELKANDADAYVHCMGNMAGWTAHAMHRAGILK